MDIQLNVMEIIGNSGECRSLSFEALKLAKNGAFHEAEEKLNLAKERMVSAHKFQTSLIFAEAEGDKVEMGPLMVHAQDHLMTSSMFRDLIKEFVEVYKKLDN
ncbi:PTS lactose/cellobiose transporter subunit IIA [Clostridium oceanicum]|uniref:PTS lactose/cellobiose transporter subunit IIA n=1 Tax=Clostridium oceanicum TaxID=1543 RepID=A0ABP3UWD6_9CLOT